MSKSIAILIDGHEGFGVRAAISSLIDGLGRRACLIHVISLSRGAFAVELAARGVSLSILPCGRLPSLSGGKARKALLLLTLAQQLVYARKCLVEELRRCGAGLLHSIWPLHLALAGPAAAKVGIPCFWQMNNAISRHRLPLNRACYQVVAFRYDVVPVANSQYTARSLGDSLVTPHVVYLGADHDRFRPRPRGGLRRRLGLREDAIIFAAFARPDPRKGQRQLIEAIIDRQVDDDVHLLLVGGSPADSFFRELSALAAEHSNRIHLLETTAKPEELMAEADVVVSCGLDPEAFGFSAVEGMLCGKPVLVHALGGPAETVVDGVSGWHVGTPTVAAIKAGIERALHDRPRWSAMGEEARSRGLHFSTEAYVERYVELLEGYLGPRSASQGPCTKV